MKKLSLKKLNLGANDLLQKNQLKTIFGGNGGYGNGDGSFCICLNSSGQIAHSRQFTSADKCRDFCGAECQGYTQYGYGCA